MPSSSYLEQQVIRLKHWYKSATVWIGTIIVAVAQVPQEAVALLHPELKDWAYSALGAAIIWVRIRGTNQAITKVAAVGPVAEDRVLVK